MITGEYKQSPDESVKLGRNNVRLSGETSEVKIE